MTSNMSPLSLEANESKPGSSSKSNRDKSLIAGVVILAVLVFAFMIAVIILAIKSSKDSSSDTDDVCRTAECVETALDIMRYANTSVDPCEDFYNFACGKWAIYNSERANGGTLMDVITYEGFFRLHGYFQSAVNDESLPTSVRKIAQAYMSCGAYRDLKDADKDWLAESLREMGGWPMIDDEWDERRYLLEHNLAQAIHNFVVMTPIFVTVEENLFDTSKRSIQISQAKFEEMQPLDKDRVLSVAKRLSDKDEKLLTSEYEKVEEFAEYLTKISRLIGELQDDPTQTKAMTLRELKAAIPWINWTNFLDRALGSYVGERIRETETVVVVGIDYLKQLFDSINRGKFSQRTFANYLAVSFIRNLLDVNLYLGRLHRAFQPSTNLLKGLTVPEGFSDGCFNFFASRATAAADFLNYRNRKTAMVDKKMISYFTSAMRDLITEVSWLDDSTRKSALEKLDTTNFFIGFADRYKNPNEVENFFAGLPNFTSNVLQSQVLIRRHSYKKIIELLRKPSSRTEWPYAEGGHGSQVNAFHVHYMNVVVLPADLQVKPIFDAERPKFWNFGAYGWVLGHEITHGFDTSGSKRDKYGNMRNWWMPQAKKQFSERAKCFIEQYDKIPYGYQDHYVNGTQTVAENVADNGGLRQAYKAYKKWEKDHGKEKRLPAIEQYSTDQLFFIASAQIYCSAIRSPETLYSIHYNDYHSPTPMRVNPAVANFDAFGKAFNCKSGSAMNPRKRCITW